MADLPDGPEAPEDGYPDPGKYTPDNLGEKKIWESRGRLQVILSPSAVDYLGGTKGDKIRFTKSDEKDGVVEATLIEDEQ